MQKNEVFTMKKLFRKYTEEEWYLIAGTICMIVMFPLLFYISPKHGVKVYDCSIAEISPDYPLSVKEECRKARSEKIK